MAGMRIPFFFLALVTMVLVIGFELSTLVFIRSEIDGGGSAPGLSLPYLALLDGLILYALGLMALALMPQQAILTRIQAILTLVVSFLGIIGTILLALVAFGLIMLMVGLLLAVPFGTIAYLIAFADFPKNEALTALTLIMTLKLFTLLMLVLANEGFLKNFGLLILFGLSLLGTWLASLLIAFPPSFLSSITDAVAALIIAVIAIVRLIMIFVSSILALTKIVQVGSPLKQV